MTDNNEMMTPEALGKSLKDEPDIVEKIQQISDLLVKILEAIGVPGGISKVRNIRLTLVIQNEIFQRLFTIYSEIYGIYERLGKLLKSGRYDEADQEVIQNRAEEIVNDQLFLLQREVFFKIVNAKEVAEGEKNEDGPALLFPGIEKVKNSIIRKIQQQTSELNTVAVDICKTFHGIADSYVAAEQLQPGEKAKYDTIYQTFEQEKKIKVEHLDEINTSKLDDLSYLDKLIDAFEQLKDVYRQKSESLSDIDPATVTHYPQKIAILEKGSKNTDTLLKPLRVLKNMSEQFPTLEKQLDFFADSHYQARAVLNVLDQVKEEMGHVFSRYNLESFTVVSFLKYKLNGISHMYESIHYYYAVIQIENDMREALTKRYAKPEGDELNEAVKQKLETIGISRIVQSMHQWIASMNIENYQIHQSFLKYKDKPELERLKKNIKKTILKLNATYTKVKKIYKTAQKIFSGFLIEDLGATDLESQFSNYLKANRNLPEAESVTKGFNTLLATKRKTVAGLEKEFSERFEGKVSVAKISAMALLKVKKDFLKELLKEIQQYSHVQEIFLEVLKNFIKLQDGKKNQKMDDRSIFREIEQMAGGTFDNFKNKKSKGYKKLLKKSKLTERDITMAFLAANITPQEIESFSRLLPVLPRNELQLDSPYGRFLLDIISLYQEQLQYKGASVAHLAERIYEKREHLKLIGNISLFLKTSADPFIAKIKKEEKTINHLIDLQRRKYRRELTEIIRYWQYLIQEQLDPGQGKRGRFRRYSEDEKRMMIKYISPNQLDLIDRQLESSLDLVAKGELHEVEDFLLEIVTGLFQLFKEAQTIMAEFEMFERGKKLTPRNAQDNDNTVFMASDRYVPNIKMRLNSRKEKAIEENTDPVEAEE